ncbi:MAG: 6-phosphofructokinase [Lachnospiraceae bacterium]|jgi:6-phosphofructokinase 1
MFDDSIRTIGVLTSGGDAPGMNAAIRAVTRNALANGLEVRGIKRGFHGLLKEEVMVLNARDVSDTLMRGGTFIQTARSKQMMTKEGQVKAASILNKFEIDALVVIGGDGSFKGAKALSELGIKVICIPGTIDMDIACTEYTIGFDTAINTAMEAVDKIKETSSSHERCSIIEVMGRNAGYIALWCGIATGAEKIFIPEVSRDIDKDALVEDILSHRGRKKNYTIINAEGVGHSTSLARYIEEKTGIETRASILGYMQRGGSPTCTDRVYASRMGALAVELLLEGKYNRVIAVKDGAFVDYDIDEALGMEKSMPMDLYEMASIIR